MKYTVCAYFDLETHKYNPPMLFPFDTGAVVETISSGVTKGKIEGAKDFDLFLLGTYETETAGFTLLEKPEKLLHLADFVKQDGQA